ncbi:hypothetical protein, partial [Burkholderia multivorans]|uniref:hypothetical protein n=2 Tax=Burkholderia multivorans TaxID=87883 RepID=UPI0021C098D6
MATFIVVGAKMGIRKFYVDLPDKALIPYRSRLYLKMGRGGPACGEESEIAAGHLAGARAGSAFPA